MLAAVADNSVTRTLERAARTIGGRSRLAEYLGVGEAELEEWLDGRRAPPAAIYVRALDLVANGPFGARREGRAKRK